MLILFTGLPGASKTLNMIKYVCEDDLFNLKGDDGKNIMVDKQPVKRPVYYHNINDLQIESWKQLDDSSAKKPSEIEKGAVIIYDECQDIFPVLPNSKAGSTPEHYTYMNKHRHNGHDIILVTQHPKNLNTQLRRLVNKHIHFKRIFGTTYVTKFEYQKCMDEPEEHFSKKESQVSKVEIDKNYFNKYKSAEVHTVKRNLPVGKLIKFGLILLVTFSAIGALVYFLIELAKNQTETTDVSNNDKKSVSSVSQIIADSSSAGKVLTPEDYAYKHTPRVDGLPHTAPIYDKLTEPKSFPRIAACVHSIAKDKCSCYTQQATPIETTYDICMSVVENGYFDHTKVDLARVSKTKRSKSQRNNNDFDPR